MPYILHYGSDEQKAELLPRMLSGETIVAIAMTEPGAGSDLQGVRTSARRDGDDYVINGAKTFITNGQNADVIITVCKTNPDSGAKGTSLFLVEADRPGFARGRSEAHTSEIQSLMRNPYAVFCLNKKKARTTAPN